ncbi:MAG: alpha-glucuronidase, partial [Bacteroidales bacterium]|nr:alpha-glucuronidase [Bacteroidales bacterium]
MAVFCSALTATAQTSNLWLNCPEKPIASATLYCNIPDKSQDAGTKTVIVNEFAALAQQLKVAKSPKDKNINYEVLIDNTVDVGAEGFSVESNDKGGYTIKAKTAAGALYGTYSLMRAYKIGKPMQKWTDMPRFQVRILNHWDNPDGSVERGYAGRSIWFDGGKINFRSDIETYARANASVGINGTVIDNVNADPKVLDKEILSGVKTIADRLRPYNIKVYLAVNFSSPAALGGLKTSDPLDNDVIDWWKKKVDEIYTLIPNFGGFLVKANSEGLPGPMDFGRTHADGANMLAKALKPHGGIVMWRAFVYNPQGGDRAKQAYEEFMPLDGKFDDNVIIQIKNGPVDFQPREPFSPLFGAMKKTQTMAELQITQEYLGYSDHLCYLATMWKEFMDYPTFHGNQSVVQTTLNQKLTAFSAVANTGTMKNWCGYVMAQANWYAFGRLAWNPWISARQIAKEWVMQTITKDEKAVNTICDIMMESREAVTNYMTPLGLHHLMGWSDHWGPEPWTSIPGAREDWLPRYYHKADKYGLGFNRSSKNGGSNAVEQYQEPLRSMYDDPRLCPKEMVLWFHHLPWNYCFNDGKTLWQSLNDHYNGGVQQVVNFQKTWQSLKGSVPESIFKEVEG